MEDFYLQCADDAKCKMIGDILELLKKPTVYSQEERSKILERNQDQNVARTAFRTWIRFMMRLNQKKMPRDKATSEHLKGMVERMGQRRNVKA